MRKAWGFKIASFQIHSHPAESPVTELQKKLSPNLLNHLPPLPAPPSHTPIPPSGQKHMFSNEENSSFDAESAETTAETQKRNSGRTGPTSFTGRQTSARNATRHGMCATTLILPGEVEADWLDLFQSWLNTYQNPAENTVLYTFVIKTAQAEWRRLRIEREYDFHIVSHGNPPIGGWQPEEIKTHDLILRYLTTAERRFQREYKMLEHHFKTHHKPAKSAPEPEPDPAPREMPKILYVNNETGEAVDAQGNEYPPPPDYKPEPIIPGVYPPDHPAYPFNPPKEKRRR
jgi:hypothetical protein